MQYLVSVIDDTAWIATNSRDSSTEAERAAIDVFDERLRAEGHWVFAGGLGAPTVIDNRAGKAMVTDGPFVETKEYIAGFWIIEAAAADEAISLGTEASKACNRRVEVRPFL